MRHELLSQQEADEIYFDQEEKVSVLGMTFVARNRRMPTRYVMPKSCGVKCPGRCYEVHTTRVAWTPDELNYGRKCWGRTDEREQEEWSRGVVPRKEPSRVVSMRW